MTEYCFKSSNAIFDQLNACQSTGSPSFLSRQGSAAELFQVGQVPTQKYFDFEEHLILNVQNTTPEIEDKKLWALGEEKKLLDLHQKLGNKWTSIADHFPNRNHNSIKNYFYSQIRKSLRRLNHFIKKYLNQQHKKVNVNHVSKMITLASEKSFRVDTGFQQNNYVFELTKFLFDLCKKDEGNKMSTLEVTTMSKQIFMINQLLQTTGKLKKVIKSENIITNETKPQRVSQVKPKILSTNEQMFSKNTPQSSRTLSHQIAEEKSMGNILIPEIEANAIQFIMFYPYNCVQYPIEYFVWNMNICQQNS